MLMVKIHCTLGLNYFFIPQLTLVKCGYPTSCNWQVRNVPCSVISNWKMKEWMRFVNTVTQWLMPVRQSLCNLQRLGAFTAAFTKKFTLQLADDSKFFQRAFANPYTKQSERCAPYCAISN
jgi:hypothetical protein